MASILAETVAAFATRNHLIIDKKLENLGWLTPNSYGRDFCEPPTSSALYIFTLFNYERETSDALYVGQSKNLKNRWERHQILSEISKLSGPFQWIIKRFIPWEVGRLRHDERFLISGLNPPFNIIGKRRGIS